MDRWAGHHATVRPSTIEYSYVKTSSSYAKILLRPKVSQPNKNDSSTVVVIVVVVVIHNSW